jgi:hypothetical protein
MEDGLLNQGQGLLEVKTDEYYLYFLEQCVQIVSRKLIAGEITLTDVEQDAVNIINKMIRDFYFVRDRDKTYLEQVNSILGDLKEPTIKLMTISRTSTISVTEEYYNNLIEILNTKAQEYSELQLFATTLPILFENYKNSEDSESGMASNSTISALVKELKALLSMISIIQTQTATKANAMLNKVMSRLNEKIVIGKPTLARIRKEMVLEAIRETKIQAKILMRKILKEEIATMSSNFAANLYSKPSITNIRKYFLDTDTKIILRNNDLQYFDVAAIPASGNNPLNSLAVAPESNSLGEIAGAFGVPSFTEISTVEISSSVSGSTSGSVPIIVDPITNENGYFILERYIRIQDRELPLSGTTIPQEITNRPEHINGVVNVTAFKDWVSTLSDSTKNTEMFKLFGDYTVSGSSTEGYTLSGSTLGLKYGLRLSFVPPTSIFDPTVVSSSLADINSEKAYYLQPAYSYDGEEYTNSSYIIPIASGETDLVDDLLGNFDPDSGLNAYNHDCLIKELYDSNEFRFLFYYCFPLQKYMSAASIFTTETYVRAIGLNDGWENTPEVSFDEKYLNFYKSKEACQILFEIYYNWEDTEYQNTKLSSLLNGKDSLMQSLMAWLRPVPGWPLITVKDRVVSRRPYDDEGNECDVQD